MVLVSYSDSEGSGDENPQPPAKDTSTSATRPDTKFAIDKANPRKIKVNLQQIQADLAAGGEHEDGPAPKRPKIGGGFSGFNSMLPAPKQDTKSANEVKRASNGAPRKVFSLKTGAEPGFSRESDAELRQLFAEQGTDLVEEGLDKSKDGQGNTGTDRDLASPVSQRRPPQQGHPMIFKPLSVTRNVQKKNKPAKTSAAAPVPPVTDTQTKDDASTSKAPAPAPKVNLFSIGSAYEPSHAAGIQQTEYHSLVYQSTEKFENPDPLSTESQDLTATADAPASHAPSGNQTQSLNSIAADLNLSASAKRQLLGRNHKDASKISSSIINFNTDEEYAANEALRASGEQVQHNPVRAIAPGKHSLKQLVNAASGQKEALEESFASGRRNKKEAGGRYGW